MFAAMMDGVKEESVGFLFNLEVQVDDEPAAVEADQPVIAPAAPLGDGDDDASGPQLDVSLLKEAQEHHEGAPHIKAKGLDPRKDDRPLTYSAPELGSEAPAVQTDTAKAAASADSATARRQQARTANPNRGSRGNKKAGNTTNRNKRKK
jgi:preprotein translocase subunit SecA